MGEIRHNRLSLDRFEAAVITLASFSTVRRCTLSKMRRPHLATSYTILSLQPRPTTKARKKLRK
jgi:hypothetical protein